MRLCWIQRGLWSVVLASVWGVTVQSAVAQEPPAEEPQVTPTSRPALKPQTPEEAEAMERLLRLRDEMQKQEEARQKAGEQPTTPPPTHARPGVRRPPTTPAARAPVTNPRATTAAPPTATKGAGDEHPEIPDDFVGPPSYLAPEKPAGSESRTLTPAELRERAARERGERPGAESEPAETETETEDAPLIRRPKNDLNEKTEWFNFNGTPWEDVIKVFVDRIGKPLMGDPADLIIGGSLTYVTDRKFTKDEALDELNLLMYEQGYRFVEQENHVRIIPISEMKWWVPVKDIFPTIAAFDEANPRNMDYVIVYYQAGDKPAKLLIDAFSEALPDGTLMEEVADTNKIKITALARDVRRFMALVDKIDLAPNDPRQIRPFNIKTNAHDIEQLVRSFMKLGSSTPQIQMVRDPRTGRMIPQRVNAGGGQDDSVQIVADDRTNSIIVKATEDKLKEVALLIEEFDQKPEIGEFETTVVEVKHADATEVANLLNQIFQQEQGQSQTPAWQLNRLRQMQAAQARGRRGQTRVQTPQAQGAAPEDILAEGIFERAKKTVRLVADARLNVLIVYANADGLARVRKTLDLIDQPQPENLMTIPLENATLADIAPMVTQIVNSTTEGGRGVTLVPDEAANAFHVIAERDDMERITKLIQQLDVPGPEKERHVLQLKKLKPSQVASMIQSLLSEGSSARSASTPLRGRFNRGRMPTQSVTQAQTYQLIPLDEAEILIVYCSDEDWERIDETVQLWEDNALTSTPELQTFPITKGNAAAIAEKLNAMYRSYQHPILGRSSVAVEAEGDKIWVYGVRPAIEEIGALIEQLDVEGPEDRVEILPLQYADASQVAQQLQVVLRTQGRGRGATTGPVIQPEPVTNSLIVQAEKADLEKIKDFALRMDQEVSAQQPERKFFTPRYADAREVATAVQQLYGIGGRIRGQAAGTSIKAFPSGAQVVVEAPKDKMVEIEAFIQQLDDPQGREIVIKPIKLEGADVNAIASKLSNAFRIKPNTSARFDPDPASETIVVTCTRDEFPDVQKVIDEMVETTKGVVPVVEFRQMTYAQAPEAANWLRDTLVTYISTNLGRNAASQIRVTADPRTNRVVINGPKFAVEYGKVLLDQYDVEVAQPPAAVVQNDVRKLPGLNVQALANSLTTTFRNQPRRTDGLNATFVADPTTETLIVSAPKDMYEEINRIISQYESEARDVEPEQKFVQVENTDANYLVGQVRNVLVNRIAQTRGRGVADRISITAEPRLNQIILNAPKFIIPMAEELIAKLDQPPTTQSQLQTIPLVNADASTVFNVIRQIFDEKIRARTLQVSVEPLTNSLIVGGSKEDFEQIQKWAKDLDDQAITKGGELKIVDVLNANPWEIVNILTAQYSARKWGQRNKVGNEMSFYVVGGRSVVVQATKDKMPEILDLIERLDKVGVDKVEVRTYELRGIGSGLNDLAREVGNAINAGQSQRERRVTLTPYPAADTLIVTARADQFAEIEQMMDKFKSMVEKETTVTKFIKLEYLDAGSYAGQIQNMLANKLQREGQRSTKSVQNLQITADTRTNRLICYLPDKIVPDLDEIIKELDVPAEDYEGRLRVVELVHADCNAVANALRPMFEQVRNQQRTRDASQIIVRIQPESNSNSLLITASDSDFEEIKKQALWMDEKALVQGSEPQIVNLAYADANEVANMINQWFGQRRGENESQRAKATVVNGTLVVAAPKSKFEEIKQLISDVDQQDNTAVQIKTYDLKVLSAGQVQIAVQNFLRDMGSGSNRRGQLKPGAFAEPTTNTLVVLAPPEIYPMIDNLIATLEGKAPQAGQMQSYVLTNVRAEQITSNVDAMLKAKVMEREGAKKSIIQTSVFAEPATNRLFVYAPEEYQKLAGDLIKMIDQQVESTDIVHIVTLENADATQMAQSLQGVIQGNARGSNTPGARSGTATVRVTADAGSNSLILAGMPKDVAEVENWIGELEQKGSLIPELQIFQLTYATPEEVMEPLKNLFPSGGRGRNVQDAVTITPDDYKNQLVVTANRRKMRQVEEWVKQLDRAPEMGEPGTLPGGRQVYFVDISRGSASNIAWDVRDSIGDFFPPEDKGGPSIESDWFDEYLIVRCRPTEFPTIENLIRQFERRIKLEITTRTYDVKGDTNTVLQYLAARGENVEIIRPTVAPVRESLVEPLWKDGEEPDAVKAKRDREKPRGGGVAPAGAGLSRAPAQPQGWFRFASYDPPATEPAPARVVRPVVTPPAATPVATGATATSRGAGQTVESPVVKEPLKIVVQPDGTLLIQGDKKDVDDITDVMDVITEDLAAGEVIRIFQFKYGDVSAAAEVLNIMFDVQQRQPIVIQQQQQQRGRQGQGREGEDQRPQSMFDQLRGMTGAQGQQKSTPQMRIATDPGHNYLIIKCNASDLPDIRQLLRELDIPPGEVKIQVFQLKNLEASETAENIKDVLGISKVQQRRTGGRGNAGQRGAQQQLMEMLQQQMVSVPGVEGGAKVERVEIVPNQITNSLMVSAPPEVMGVIENVINELEQLGGIDVVGIHYYPLKLSRVDDIVPLLQEIFDATAGGGGGGGKRGGRGGGGSSPAALGPVTISGDPRTNTLIYTAENKDVDVVEAQIKALDIEGTVAEAETYICVHGDASSIATAVQAIFGGTTNTGRRGGDKGAAAGTSELRIIAEPTTNTITVWGPLDKRDLIFAKISELDQLNNQEIANIPVQNVPPSQIISFIYQFLDQTTAGGGEGRGKGAAAETGPQIVPNDNGKTLIVRGNQRQVEEIRDLVAKFDDPDITVNQVAVLPVPYGEDPDQLAASLQQIINDSEQQRAELTGAKPRQVTIAANQYTHTIIVAGDSTAFGLVRTVMDQLRDVRSPNQPVTKILQVRNLSAESAVQMINELQQNTGSSGSGTRRSTTTPSRPRTPVRRNSGGRGEVMPSQPLHEGAPALLRPYFGLTTLTPALTFVACQTVTQDDPPATRRQRKPIRTEGRTRLVRAFQPGAVPVLDDDPPPTTRPARAKKTPARPAPPKTAPAQPAPTKPAPTTPAPTKAAAAPAPAQPEPPAPRPSVTSQELLDVLSGVSGQLKGEVQAQALDSQQLVITGDPEDIAFIEQILAVMEASKSPPAIEVFALKYAKAAVLGPIIETVIKSEADVRGAEEQFSVNVEGRSNSLIVSASENVMDRIAALVEQLDVDKEGEGSVVRMVVVNNMRAAEAVALLKPAIDKLNAIGEVPKEAQASVTAVERSNAVMIVGTQKDVEQIEKLVQDVDVELVAKDKATSFTTADVILVQLKNGSAEDVAKVLMDMIEEQQKNARNAGGEKPGEPFVKVLRLRLADGRELPDLNLDRPIKIVPEKGTNSLIIFSNKENNEALTEIVRVFDTLPVGADTDVKAFVLAHARAEDIAKLLDDVFKNKQYLTRPSDGDSSKLEKGVLPPVPPGLAAQGLPYPLVVQSDVRSNTVIVIGRKDAVILAGGLISELDRTSMDLGVAAHVLGPLKFMQSSQMADKLDKLLADRAKALGADKNEARDSAVIQAEERSNSLIVFATEEMYNLIEDLVLELDSTPKYSVVDVRYRNLKYADAQKLQGMLEEMFKAKEDAEKKSNKDAQDTLTVLADLRSNSLLLTGTRDYLDEAEGLIGQLDQQYTGTVELRAFKIRLNSATNIATLLKDMVDKALKQQDSKLKGTEIQISADPVSDTLLVVAAREDLDVIGRWVEILDRPSEVGRMTAIIPVRRSAEETAKAAQDIFKFGGKQGGEVDVTITHDPGTNSVVAFGPPALVKDIETLVRQLDGTDPLGMAEVRIFKLTQADAEKAGDLLQRVLEGQSGSVGGRSSSGGGSSQDTANQVMLIWQSELKTLRAMRTEIKVLADIRTNSLFVTAPPEAMGLMESLIHTIDVPPESANVRVFRLVNADAEQMVETLKELFKQETVSSGGSGSQSDTERELMIEGMTVAGGRQQIAFTTDVRTNSVIAAGTPGYLDIVEQMILDLDTVPIQDREILVYSPKYMPAADLAPTIKEFSDNERKRLEDIGKDISTAALQEREVSAIANEAANRVVLSVDPRFKSTLMNVIEELDRPIPQVMIQVLIIEVTVDNTLDLGVEFAFQDLQYAKAGPTDTTTFDYVGGTDIGAAGSGLGGFTFTITGADFNFLFRTLQSEGSLKVLSRPQIIAMDNKPAKIDISDDVPYVTGTQTSTTGQISTSVGRKSVGIVLEVTPQINPDGFVSMEVKQEVSDITDSTISVGPGVTSPVFFTRKAESNIMVKDNETVVLGGLITSRSQQREQKVPIMGDIPVLGSLFRYQNDTSKRTELLIVLTPRVLRTVEDYRNLSIAERDNMSLIPDEMMADELLQGLQRVPEATEAAPPAGRATAVPLEEPLRPDAIDEDTYGPIRPALQPDTRPADPDSYDIPLTWKGAQRL